MASLYFWRLREYAKECQAPDKPPLYPHPNGSPKRCTPAHMLASIRNGQLSGFAAAHLAGVGLSPALHPKGLRWQGTVRSRPPAIGPAELAAAIEHLAEIDVVVVAENPADAIAKATTMLNARFGWTVGPFHDPAKPPVVHRHPGELRAMYERDVVTPEVAEALRNATRVDAALYSAAQQIVAARRLGAEPGALELRGWVVP